VRAALVALPVAAFVGACGGGSDDEPGSPDRGAGVGALGGSALTETLANTRLRRVPRGELAWVAHEIPLDAGQAIEHDHEPAFVYGRRGTHSLDGASIAEGEAAPIRADSRHRHAAVGDSVVLWEIRLARPGAPAPPGARVARVVFESEPLEAIPMPAEASLIEVTVPPRGGQTTVHTHPGPEFIYQLAGRIDYQNAIVGTKRLGPGGAEGIPPGTAVQKRNPYAEPGTFLSLFLVDPEQPFAPKASF
jgi:quercetin dioxygenase-like cupin family protein